MNGLIHTMEILLPTRTIGRSEDCGEDVEFLDLGRCFRSSGTNRFKHVKRSVQFSTTGEDRRNSGRDKESRRTKEREFERLELAIRQGSANA